MRHNLVAAGLAVLMLVLPAVAQTTQPAAESSHSRSYQTGEFPHWQRLTGDWGGARSQLEDIGIKLDMSVTNILQGNAHGGRSTNNGLRYSGSNDLELTLDTGKMGLWPGGTFIIKAEGVWGGGIDRKVGALLPVNFDAAKPGSAEPGFGLDEGCRFLLSEFIYTQALAEGKLILIAGKLFGGSRGFDGNVFANDEQTQFMNVAFRNNPLIPGFLPYTTLGAGFVVNPTEWLSILTAAADSDGRAKTTGFETAFHGDVNTTVIHEWVFTIKPFGLPGHQRVGFAWTCKDVPRVRPNEPFGSTGTLAVKLLGPDLAQKVVKTLATYDDGGDNVMVYYNFDQFLYTEADDPTQGIGLFGRFGWARQDVNPAAHFYSIGVGGKGVIPDRDRDTCGLGYYFLDLSNDLPAQFHSEQGIEMYYSIEVFPWLHISPDFQIIMNPGGGDFHDCSLVYGLRMHMNL